jgi:DNA (cytosine-5)-methyltransferase 1
MKYLSVCSGIEAASVAWHPLGWRARAVADIDLFANAVTAHHYPDVPNLGDLTKWRDWDQDILADADVLVGGTPCQAFSVAGLRNSLADDRGNLSLEFVRLADAIDDLRLDAGREPSIIVWENVPGVLSVRDNAFGCFLSALAGEDEPFVPARGKWTNAGVAHGPSRAVAWRILDAQYFGLAQRRRRVFVVASAREGFDPAAVLLEFEGLRRDSPPRREARQVAPTIPSRSTAGGGLGTDFDCDGGVITLAHGQAGAEIARERSPTLTCVHEAPIAAIPVTHSLRAEGFDAGEDGTGRGTPLVPVYAQELADPITANEQKTYTHEGANNFRTRNVIAFSAKDHGGDASVDLSPTLRAIPHHGSHANGGGQMAVAIPVQEVGKRTGSSTDDPRAGIGIGEDGDPMYTLQAGAQHGVAAYAFQPRIARNGRGDMGEVVNALNAQSGETGKGDAAPCVAVQASQSGVRFNDTVGTLDANYGSRRHNGVMQHMAVRRLTPVECERLQGFPDGYTNIPWRGKPEAPDGPRYKSLGNSMAVPVMRWIGKRIAEALT